MEYETFLQKVGKNIRTARHAKGLTLEQATSGRGGYRYLWELEAGKRNPSMQTLHQLAVKFGVSPCDFLDVAGSRPSKVRLTDLKPEPPKRGRKPKKKRR